MALVVLDASVVIAALETDDANHAAAIVALRQRLEDDLRIPASALAEALVSPFRRGAASAVREKLDELGLVVAPLDEDAAVRAAELRAHSRTLRLPDALVAATGETLDADLILTLDRRLARMPRARYIG